MAGDLKEVVALFDDLIEKERSDSHANATLIIITVALWIMVFVSFWFVVAGD